MFGATTLTRWFVQDPPSAETASIAARRAALAAEADRTRLRAQQTEATKLALTQDYETAKRQRDDLIVSGGGAAEMASAALWAKMESLTLQVHDCGTILASCSHFLAGVPDKEKQLNREQQHVDADAALQSKVDAAREADDAFRAAAEALDRYNQCAMASAHLEHQRTGRMSLSLRFEVEHALSFWLVPALPPTMQVGGLDLNVTSARHAFAFANFTKSPSKPS